MRSGTPFAGRCNIPIAYLPTEVRNREANAALIAAAPDLRDALIELMEWNAFMGNFDAPCWDKARAAIAKAGGAK